MAGVIPLLPLERGANLDTWRVDVLVARQARRYYRFAGSSHSRRKADYSLTTFLKEIGTSPKFCLDRITALDEGRRDDRELVVLILQA